jgi:hypothetical protein
MGDFDTGLHAPSATPSTSLLPPVPDVTLPRSGLFGAAEGSATLDGFAFGKAELTGMHHTQLARLAGSLKQLLASPSGGTVQVVGHTDKVGTEKDNQALGQQRADAVRDELVVLGLAAADIETRSLGPGAPVVDTPKPEPKNRRVEVSFSARRGPRLTGVMTGKLTRPAPLEATPPPKVPTLTGDDFCKLYPKECDPDRLRPDFFKPIPELPKRKVPSLTDAIWQPIDKALEKGLKKLGVGDTLNKALRDAARGAAEKGATSVLDQALDQAGLTGDTRKAAEAALKAAAQQEVPFQ